MTRLLLLLAAVTFLSACSSRDEEEPERRVRVNVQPFTRNYTEVEQDVTTRGWVTPDGYYPYDSEEVYGKFINQINLTDKTIRLFFTQDNQPPIQGSFVHSRDDEWYSTFEITAGNYFLYGFIPSMGGVTASVSSSATPSDNSSYSQGAVLNLRGLPTVTANDICVIVGAKNGRFSYEAAGDYNVDGLETGQFGYYAYGDEGNYNYVFLLFDHLYAALRISFKMDPVYAALRTIKVKKLELEAEDDNGNAVKKRANMTIVLKATTDGSSPIQSITHSYVEGSGDTNPMFQAVQTAEGDGAVALSGDAFTDFMGSFIPTGISQFTLASTYDVYDSAGNLIRKDCKSKNKLNLNTMFPADRLPMKRGVMYAVQLTVKPTFLYVLSDPDLDNPTIEVE